ncbi:MAG TPA: MraY family glycosyltransferase [Candidatus Saccharimonadia bacterium]|jgi:UDP-GlcNAc:undecaprenyl-phosphate GlcNAc-1-phosphate transferase
MILGEAQGGGLTYLLGFGLAFGVTAALTPVVRRYALAHGIVDRPDSERKLHGRVVAYLGGVAIFAGFVAAVLLLMPFSRELAALLLGCAILVVVGVVDDLRGLSPWIKLGFQVLAAGVALAGGIGLTGVHNPFGGYIDFSAWRFQVDWLGLKFHIAPVANFLSLMWMVGLANTINFLDGLDGLASGVSGIAAVVMFAVGQNVHQPAVALLAIILAGSAFGFLPFNFYPARIFMGDSGAYFLGLILAMLAIYSGAKLATAVLVLGFPIVDAIWAAVRRSIRRTSPFKADRKHFHYLLLDTGMSQRQAVLTLYAVALVFGTLALFMGSFGKLVALVVLTGLMAVAIGITVLVSRAHRA